MMKTSVGKWLVIAVLCWMVACGKDPTTVPDPSKHSDATINQWIYTKMVSEYLYNSKAKAMTNPQYDQPCEDFFTSLLSNLPTDNDGKHTNGDNYYYSYLERTNSKVITRLETGVSSSYGIQYVLYSIQNSPGSYYARVYYVVKGSSADRAGVQRGDWITKIEGKSISKANYKAIDSGGAITLLIEREVIREEKPAVVQQSHALEAATKVDNTPVFLDTVIMQGAKRIAYLVYNQFETGPNGYSDLTYETQLEAAFVRMKAKNPTDMVLDLRYNTGGYLTTCVLLSSMIAPQEALGQTFSRQHYNKEQHIKKGVDQFDLLTASAVAATNLNCSKLYVLTGQWTASASELLMNGLHPYLDVVQIGATTEGKNVGSYAINNTTYSIHLQPITFRIYNKNDESNYAAGFVPEERFNRDETLDLTQMYPLGDVREYLLSSAIADIMKLDVAPKSPTRAAAQRLQPTRISSLNDRPLSGLIDNTKIQID